MSDPAPRPARVPYRRVSSNRRILHAEVVSTLLVSPGMMRVTIGGPDLADFSYFGDDHAFRFFFPRRQQADLRLPPAASKGWMLPYMRMPSSERHVRFYTVRAFRRETREMDIEFVMHGEDSPGSAWAFNAGPGDRVGIFDEGAMYFPSSAGWQLLVGDESALPAILAVLEQHPDLSARAVVEVPTDADVCDRAWAGSAVDWLPRNDPSAVPGRLALQHLAQFDMPSTLPSTVYIAGESGLATGARRLLIGDRGVPKSSIKFVGYWKYGRSSHG